MVFSADDDFSRPSPRLFNVALEAIRAAQTVNLSSVIARMTSPPFYPDVWPGEHYKLLAGLVMVLQPKRIIEIGTSTGLSALTMKRFLPADGKIITFDIVPWNRFTDTTFLPEDFDNSLSQKVADLSIASNIQPHLAEIQSSTLIFIDAAKDGRGEQHFIDNLRRVRFDQPPVVVFDDIRLWNMLKIWREISAPKLDITSFGHWSGTGLVDWVWGAQDDTKNVRSPSV